MGSIHRIAVTIAGLLTAAAIAGVFVVQGYVSAQEASPAPTIQATTDATAEATASPTLDPQVIYINPVPTPKVINVTKPARPVKAKPPVVHVIVPSPTEHEDDGESDD
jgi:hypothetical protein